MEKANYWFSKSGIDFQSICFFRVEDGALNLSVLNNNFHLTWTDRPGQRNGLWFFPVARPAWTSQIGKF
jgi:hypothetical protein